MPCYNHVLLLHFFFCRRQHPLPTHPPFLCFSLFISRKQEQTALFFDDCCFVLLFCFLFILHTSFSILYLSFLEILSRLVEKTRAEKKPKKGCVAFCRAVGKCLTRRILVIPTPSIITSRLYPFYPPPHYTS